MRDMLVMLRLLLFSLLTASISEFNLAWQRFGTALVAGALLWFIARGRLARTAIEGGRAATAVRFVTAILAFSVLMTVRDQLPKLWQRTLLVGCAFGIVGLAAHRRSQPFSRRPENAPEQIT